MVGLEHWFEMMAIVIMVVYDTVNEEVTVHMLTSQCSPVIS